MIDPKIREAIAISKISRSWTHFAVLVNAYVNAEARARIWEWRNSPHKYHPSTECRQNDPRHKWTLADWEREVREELEGG
jgi:hypothetical protein